ncbi:MAG TPA: glycosyltransferase, partial [Chitinophagales bacterium]|nr:glycosyltransferase [Chitinophagales bacterium]
MTIHIGFDAKRALFNATGLGNYSRILLNALSQQYLNHQYYLYTPSGQMDIAAMRFQLTDNMHLRPPQGKITSLLGGGYWRTWGMTSQFKKDSLQVFHGLSHELPLNINNFSGKKIVTIHDLLPWRYPQQYKTIDNQIYRYKWQKAVHSADVVVAVSEQTRHDLL